MANIVLGGGIGGLCTAHYLSKQTIKGVQLIEASGRVGGWIQTSQSKNGSLFEHGPRTIRPRGLPGRNTLQLIEELGLSEAVVPISRSHPAAQNRLIYVNKQLHLLPNSFKGLFKKTTPFSKAIAISIMKDLFTRRKKVADESVYDFVERRVGREIADLLISPMICGIYAGDAKEISVKALTKQLFEAEQNYGSVAIGMMCSLFNKEKLPKMRQGSDLYDRSKKEKWSVWSLQGGLETLPKILSTHLQQSNQVDVRLNAKCSGLKISKAKVIATINEEEVIAERLYCSIPSYKLGQLLGEEHSFLKKELLNIPYVTVGVVNLEYEGQALCSEGFGYLIPPNQNVPILGVIFDSCCFPQKGRTVLTVMMGGRWFEKHFGTNPTKASLLDTAIKQVQTTLKIDSPPTNSAVSILNNCIPQYVVGHSARVHRIRQYLSHHRLPLTLIGSSYDGVGVNDVILSARNAVQSFESMSV